DVAPEKRSAQVELAVPSRDVDSSFRAGHTLSVEVRIVVGLNIAHSERAVELIQSGRAKGAVYGTGERNMTVQRSQHRQAGVKSRRIAGREERAGRLARAGTRCAD